MINSLFSFTPTIPLTDEQRAAFAQVSDWVEVPECKPGTYQSYVATITLVDAIHAQLAALGEAKLIGVWNGQSPRPKGRGLWRIKPQVWVDQPKP